MSILFVCNASSRQFILEVISKMIQNPGVFNSIKPFLIEKQIDDSNLTPCQKGVVEKIKNIQSDDIAKIIAKLNGAESVYKVKIVHDSTLPEDTYGQTDWSSPIGSPFVPYDYTIKLNTQYLQHATRLSIASTIIHKMIHAYFLSLVDDYEMGDIQTINEFPILWNNYVSNLTGDGSDIAHHNQMAVIYVDVVARALQEYETNFTVPDDQQPLQVYKDLAWGGLGDMPPFLALPLAERQRIKAVLDAEDKNAPQSANGNNYSPMSSPCN